ncbi:MAG TPA: alpha/beta fold hydrolase, partial [Polyangiaceae bacterium]|nr:alpha/beta fold hydrolase [Polyangiaceae bacterium]
MTFTVALAACNPARGSSGRGGLHRWGEAVPGPSVSAEVPVRATDRGPIRIEPLPGIDPPVFAHHGRPRGPGKLVFLHGMCGHGMGYAQAFQFAAARYGTLIAPQGDSRCGNGPWAKWSRDLEALDRRILEGFRALGLAEPIEDVIVIGYSMGATRALELARKYPARYSSVILMGAPAAPTPGAASGLRAAVMMAGEHDRQDQMRAGVRAF